MKGPANFIPIKQIILTGLALLSCSLFSKAAEFEEQDNFNETVLSVGKTMAASFAKARSARLNDPSNKDLYAELRRFVTIDGGGNSRDAAILSSALEEALGSATAASLAHDLIEQGVQVHLSFGALPYSRIMNNNGQKILTGIEGSTDQDGSGFRITINENLLKTSPDYLSAALAAAISHELFGHALQRAKAQKAGVADLYANFSGNEGSAALIGWIVQVELDKPLTQPFLTKTYLKDPVEYQKTMWQTNNHFADTFTLQEMANPAGVLRQRLQEVQNKLTLIENWKTWDHGWQRAIAHFIAFHGAKNESFDWINGQIDDELSIELPHRTTQLNSIIAALQSSIRRYSLPEEIKKLQEATTNPFFTGEEKNRDKLGRHLANLMQEKNPSDYPAPAPANGQISWDQLKAMYVKHKKEYPDHAIEF